MATSLLSIRVQATLLSSKCQAMVMRWKNRFVVADSLGHIAWVLTILTTVMTSIAVNKNTDHVKSLSIFLIFILGFVTNFLGCVEFKMPQNRKTFHNLVSCTCPKIHRFLEISKIVWLFKFPLQVGGYLITLDIYKLNYFKTPLW